MAVLPSSGAVAASRLARTSLLALLVAVFGGCEPLPEPPDRVSPAVRSSQPGGPAPQRAAFPAPADELGAGCTCAGDAYNCPDFPSAAAARACFRHCLDEAGGDVHRLDRDSDGRACESNP